ncbi:Helitron helicase-like domain, partial [Fagus crenata]
IDDTDLWEMWKTSQSISNLGSIHNKVVKLRIYSLGWGCTVQTDKIHLWRLVKRVLISQLYESSNVYENKDRKKKRLNDMVITQFLKSQADIDHLMYKELCKIVT